MPLDKTKSINFFGYGIFIIFTASLWQFCRPFPYGFFDFIGLAAKAACSLTGLFLLLKSTELRSVVFLPVKLIKQANSEEWLRSLAYFVRMKSLYVNNTHYGYNLRGLAKKLNCSPACLSHHIKQLRHRGLVADHSGNMTFRGLKKISALYGGKNIGVPVDQKNQLTLLRCQIIRFNLATQEHNIRKAGVQKCPGPIVPNDFSERFYSCYAGLSAPGFGKVLGVSAAHGSALRAEMIKLGVLSAQRRYSIYFASGGAPSGGVLRTALIQGKRQGELPMYAFIKDGSILVERRMKLEYRRA
jgi:biotin operon repressor